MTVVGLVVILIVGSELFTSISRSIAVNDAKQSCEAYQEAEIRHRLRKVEEGGRNLEKGPPIHN